MQREARRRPNRDRNQRFFWLASKRETKKHSSKTGKTNAREWRASTTLCSVAAAHTRAPKCRDPEPSFLYKWPTRHRPPSSPRCALAPSPPPPPSASANRVRRLCSWLPLDGTPTLVDVPTGVAVGRFAPSSGLLLTFGPGHADVAAHWVVGRPSGPEVVGDAAAEAGTLPPPRVSLAAAAPVAWRARPAPPGAALSRDCVLEAGGGAFLVLASSTPPLPPPPPTAARGARTAAASLPRVATTSLHVLSAATGAITCGASITDDFIALGGGAGVAVDGRVIVVACARSSTARVYALCPAGRLTPVATFGASIFSDDALVLTAAEAVETAWRVTHGPPRG